MSARRIREVGAQIGHIVTRYNDGANCTCGERSADGEDGLRWANEHIALRYVSWWDAHPEVHPRKVER